MTKTLNKLLHAILPDQQAWHVYLLSHWGTIMGNLSSRVRLEKVQGDTLVLGVYDSHWMQELYLLSPMLIERINEHLDEPHVKHVRFKKVQRRSYKKTKSAPVIEKKSRPLSTRENSALKNIKDKELSQVLQKFLEKCIEE